MKTIDDMLVKDGESVSRERSINKETQTVRLFNVSKNDKTNQNYKVDWTFDFSNCSQEELLELASRSAVIAFRKNFRDVAEDNIPEFAQRTIDVKQDILTHQARGKSAAEKAATLISKMSDDEKAALLEQLGL